MHEEVMTYIAECLDTNNLQDIIDNAKDRKKSLEIYITEEENAG